MANIQLYSDDLYCNKRTFRVTSLIWGTPNHCEAFNQEVQTLVDSNRSILGKDFKEFHANKLNAKNWRKISPIYKEVLQKIMEYIRDGRFDSIIFVMSFKRYESNATFLKNLVKKWISDREGPIGKQFISLADEDLPPLYHSIDQLFPLLFYRDQIGKPGDNFELYPDSIGTILHYENIEFPLSGTLPVTMPISFYNIVKILGHSLIRVLPQANFEGWPISEQSLVKYEPLASNTNYLIQSCDILSNFLYNHLRFKSGLIMENSQLKSDLLTEFMDLASIAQENSFTSDGTDVLCTNEELWGKIRFILKSSAISL